MSRPTVAAGTSLSRALAAGVRSALEVLRRRGIARRGLCVCEELARLRRESEVIHDDGHGRLCLRAQDSKFFLYYCPFCGGLLEDDRAECSGRPVRIAELDDLLLRIEKEDDVVAVLGHPSEVTTVPDLASDIFAEEGLRVQYDFDRPNGITVIVQVLKDGTLRKRYRVK